MNIILCSLYYECKRVTGANKRFDFFGRSLLALDNVSLTIVVKEGEAPDWAPNVIVLPRYDNFPGFFRRILYCIKLTLLFSRFSGVIINDFMPIPFLFYKKNKYFQLVHDIRNFTDFNRAAVKKLSSLFQKFQWRMVPNILTVSEFTKQQLIKNCNIHSGKISVSYNGINPIQYKKRLRDIDFLYIATFEKRKNHEVLIRAFSKYINTVDVNACLYLVGRDLGYKERIEQLVLSLNINESVKFIEKTSEEELEALYERTRCFISPSLYEGFGMPLIEAMYFGCNVICSNITVFKEIAQKYAIYFDPNDIDDVLEAMQSVANTPVDNEEQISYIRKNFLWDAITTDFVKLTESKYD